MSKLSKFHAQATLDQCHADAMECVKMYASGLVTIPELVIHLTVIRDTYASVSNEDGLIDPTTGLSLASLKRQGA
jgi:hypothetical protein